MKKFKIIIQMLFIIYFTVTFLNAQWFKQTSPNDQDNSDVFFVNESIGYIIGISGANLLKTTDGGQNWQEIRQDGVESAIYFINANTGFIAASNGIRKTTDGGETWVTSNPYNTYLMDIKFSDDQTGYAVGLQGSIIKTSNQGETWQLLSQYEYPHLYSLFTFDSLVCYVFGSDGIMLKTTDGGLHWESIYTVSGLNLIDCYFLNKNKGYVVGGYFGSSLLKSEDAGLSWETLLSTPEFLYSVVFVDENTGYLGGGYYPGQSNPILLKTIDKGETWHDHNPDDNTMDAIYDVYFVNKCIGYAVGENGLILRTTNGGDSTICEQNTVIMPDIIQLYQNYPNPFNDFTTIKYYLPSPGNIKVEIYNVLGQKLVTLLDIFHKAGEDSVKWNGTNSSGNFINSGLYFCRLISEGKSSVIKILFLK